MLRFAKNRWWAFILTLSVLVASSATLSSRSYGDGLDPNFVYGGGDGGGGGTSSEGDPDGPGGPNKSPVGGGKSSGGNGYAVVTVGDGGTAVRVWSWRFHVVLRSLVRGWFQL